MVDETAALPSSNLCPGLPHDGAIHDPLGAGSYMFDDALLPYINTILSLDVADPDRSVPTKIHVGAQPNNSPHVGTQVTVMLGFQLARRIKEQAQGRDIVVVLNLVDTAPSPFDADVPQGYQRSLRDSGAGSKHLACYESMMALYSRLSDDLPFEISKQSDLNRHRTTPGIVSAIVRDRDRLGLILCPKRARLALRASCPVAGCGLTDKYSTDNDYSTPDVVRFRCPHHGPHSVDLRSPHQVARLEYNTPLRNLIRAFVLALDAAHGNALHVRVTGADYTGTYQDVFYRAFDRLEPHIRPASNLNEHLRAPFTLYSPLIVDWAGSKLSKSLYVKEGAYGYLKEAGLDWLLSIDGMREKGKDPAWLFDEVGRWVDDPKKLFRAYSIEYIARLYQDAERDRSGRDRSGKGESGEARGSEEDMATLKKRGSRCVVA